MSPVSEAKSHNFLWISGLRYIAKADISANIWHFSTIGIGQSVLLCGGCVDISMSKISADILQFLNC